MTGNGIVHRLRRHPLFLVVAMFVVLDLIFFLFWFLGRTPPSMTVAFLDVGQGDAVLIEAPNGNQLLYDAGPPSGAVLRELSSVLPFWDRSIDVLVLSHPDLDHIGGAVDVLRRYHVDVALESGAQGESGAFDTLDATLEVKHIPRVLARRGETIDMGSGVAVDILYPDDAPLPKETNDASVVLRVRYGVTAVILSGDLSRWGEYRVLDESSERLRANIVKLGHHGSKTSSSERWLSEIDPDVAVISSGKDNRYGHPNREVLDLLDRLHIPSVRTDTFGTIMFASDGTTMVRR